MARFGVRSALLTAFLVASGAPVVLFWLWPHSAALNSQFADVEERHLLHAKNAVTAMQRYYEQVTLVFSTTAKLIAAGENADFSRNLLKSLHFRHVCVADWGSGKVTRAFLNDDAPCPDVIPAERLAMFREMASGKTPQISPVSAPPDGGPPRMYLATRIGDQLVVGAIYSNFFRELAAGITFGKGGHAVILDRTGQVIAHPNAQWVAQTHYLGGLEPVQRMMRGETGIMTFFSPAINEEVIAGFSSVPVVGWDVMVPQPLAELHAKADKIADGAKLVLLSGLLFSAVIALVFSENMAMCIGSVTNAARQMAEGNSGVRVPRRSRCNMLIEFAELRRSFNRMAQRVDDARDRVATLAKTDRLTGLINRDAFGEEAQLAIFDEGSEGTAFVLFFVDVDHFKSINDTYGHAAGDAVLRRIAQTLMKTVSGNDIVARQSGDEFLVLHQLNRGESLLSFGQRMLEALRRPVRIDGIEIKVSSSVGAALWPEDETSLSRIISDADHAMYEVKEQGGDGLRYFDLTLRKRLESTELLKRNLQSALDRDQIDVAFQPILGTGDGDLVGFEALARWNNPSKGPIPPDTFVPLAERSGMIVELGRQVRRRAFAFGGQLAKRGIDVPISINVSQTELARGNFVAELEADLSLASLSPASIIIEITETQFDSLGAPRLEILASLREKGIPLALDDFGKGSTTHGQLLTYPLDRLKIDLAFPGSAVSPAQSRAVIRSLVDLGHCLNMKVTVEGVETAADQAFVEEIAADDVQGFWHARPMTADEALAYAGRITCNRQAIAAVV